MLKCIGTRRGISCRRKCRSRCASCEHFLRPQIAQLRHTAPSQTLTLSLPRSIDRHAERKRRRVDGRWHGDAEDRESRRLIGDLEELVEIVVLMDPPPLPVLERRPSARDGPRWYWKCLLPRESEAFDFLSHIRVTKSLSSRPILADEPNERNLLGECI
jgi:hypothetical protein